MLENKEGIWAIVFGYLIVSGRISSLVQGFVDEVLNGGERSLTKSKCHEIRNGAGCWTPKAANSCPLIGRNDLWFCLLYQKTDILFLPRSVLAFCIDGRD